MSNEVQSTKITQQDLRRVSLRNLFGLQLGWNYESMQGLGYCYIMLPALRKIYKKKEDLIKAMKTHLGYFNTAQVMSHLIVGANIALEEELGNEDTGTVTGLKAGLMGPFAGIGDTVFIAIYRAIVFSIASYIALQGNAVGLLIPLICGLGIMYLRYRFTWIGYNQGRKIATGFASSLRLLTEGASILGITVIGALVPSVVRAPLTLKLTFGQVSLAMQDMLDKIMPGLLPLCVVLFSYWLLGKKGMTSTKLIFILIALGFVLGNLNTLLAALSFSAGG